MSGSRPLRRTRGDLIVTGTITAVAVAAVAGVALTAPIRGSELTPADTPHTAAPLPDTAPESLTPAWSLADAPLPGNHSPVTVEGLVITNDGSTVTAADQAGEPVWSYARDREICAIGAAWNKIVVTYRSHAGCGDVVALSAATGDYSATRSATAGEEVGPVSSNDRVGTVSTGRVELWRSDLVRTVEYGEVEAKQESGMQPNEDCTITSALTRTDLLAVSENCPGDEGATRLRLQEANPEDSREPEIVRDIAVEGGDARLVAVGQEAATVYVPGPEPMLISYDTEGHETERRPVARAPLAEETALPFAAATADLPHHMSWFDGERLYLFTPSGLTVDHVFEGALGTGVAVGDRLLYPTGEGIAVADWESGMVERVIPVDRAGHTGGVALGLAGGTVVEKRGDEVVGLA